MDDSVELRPMVLDDFDAAIAVALSLPEWFNDLGIEQMTVDLHHQRGAVAEVRGVACVHDLSEGASGAL